MQRLLAVLLLPALSLSDGLVIASARAADGKAVPLIQREEIASPAAPGAAGASLTRAPDGTVWLSWVEPGADTENTLRCATFDATGKRWNAPWTISRDASVALSPDDFPQLAIGPGGNAVALWTDGHGGARLSTSRDRGATWSAPAPFTRESAEVEKFSLAVLADGRVLVAWLDGRGKKSGGKMQQLFARILGDNQPDTLLDPSVCDCCPTTLAAFLDGGALLAYRARTDEEVRDIRTARFRSRSWDAPRPLSNDDWRLNACPVNGPRLASDGGRLAAAWFTGADHDPRVLASFSPDAGIRFLMPLRVDRGHPTGHVDTLILHDSALLVTWVENDGSVWLRRISPDFTIDEPVALAPAGGVALQTVPRAALVRDYAGGKSAAQFVAVFAGKEKTAALHTVLVTVPEGELVEAEKNCDCAPTVEQLQGFSMRGGIVAIDADAPALTVRHGEIPGVLPAGTHAFRVAPDVPKAVQTGRQFLGRIDRRDGTWWVFDVRLLAEPTK